MNYSFRQVKHQSSFHSSGFALIATISVMVLLVMIALAMLSLSTIELRSSSNANAQQEARANARLALMIALGELQKEMGPDQRVSAESSIFDTKVDTPEIDGVQQSRWLASYNAWGGWLNDKYTPPKLDGTSGSSLSIADTYAEKRKPMFRRWLLSLPKGKETDINAPINGVGLNNDDYVVLVGHGTLGNDKPFPEDQITRAYLLPVKDESGKESGAMAWWIGGENQKAKENLNKDAGRDSLTSSKWETGQGGSLEVGVDTISGFEKLTAPQKIITYKTAGVAGVDKSDVQKHFFDVSAFGQGILASVRLGALKKDLNLLFEMDAADLPAPYRFNAPPNGDSVEPSIRPMSPELLAENPKVPQRHFASWTNMRHFYRMYKENQVADKDYTPTELNGGGALHWKVKSPNTLVDVPTFGSLSNQEKNTGSNNYLRVPIVSKLTFVFSLLSKKKEKPNDPPGTSRCYLVFTPIFTLWNPYNVDMVIPNNGMECHTLPWAILPLRYKKYLKGVVQPNPYRRLKNWFPVKGDENHLGRIPFQSADQKSDIVFKPGEMKIFSFKQAPKSDPKYYGYFRPGFDPSSYISNLDPVVWHENGVTYGGKPAINIGKESPGIALFLAYPCYQTFNIYFGNTPGSLSMQLLRKGRYEWGNLFLTGYHHDWFRVVDKKDGVPITPLGAANISLWQDDGNPAPFAYVQFSLKSSHREDYESISWEKDWRSKNWMQAPPYYFGSAQYISQNAKIADTQRADNPYVFYFGPMSGSDFPKIVPQVGDNAILGFGANPREKVTSVPLLEIPTAPLSSLAAFSTMRINPGWSDPKNYPQNAQNLTFKPWSSMVYFSEKALAYQSGVTGPAIGNSFVHPMLPQTGVYRYFDNSKSSDPKSETEITDITVRDNEVFCDYWDHVFLTNDALWDDYFTSTISDESRPSEGKPLSLKDSVDYLVTEKKAPGFSRYHFYQGKEKIEDVKKDLEGKEGYLKAAAHLMIDGIFNVNSTSVDAWHALFMGIRERKVVYRDSSGNLQTVQIPKSKEIALSRFNTATTQKENPVSGDPVEGVNRIDKQQAWSGVRFLDDGQLRKLAEECVKQVKLRGPFLNFSEFINRRLSDDALGTMGALQSAIDYDDASPESKSINYAYKKTGDDNLITKNDVKEFLYESPEAATGSRFTGIPGYVIQSDLLKPISNTLSVRDDTFRIRAYGEAKNKAGKVIARAWCEAIVQRYPDYVDGSISSDTPARILNQKGEFEENPKLSKEDLKSIQQFGRKFRIISFHWLNPKEV